MEFFFHEYQRLIVTINAIGTSQKRAGFISELGILASNANIKVVMALYNHRSLRAQLTITVPIIQEGISSMKNGGCI
jgi:hypothetical protein